MNIEIFREYCIRLKASEETFPFDDNTLVFKVMGKMFALIGLEDGIQANLKCDPEYAIELREKYPEILPGYHMNKKHWNTVVFNGSVDDKMICKLIDHSYELVVAGLGKKERAILEEL